MDAMKKRQKQRGFSLIELSLVVGLSVVIGSAVVAMFNTNLQMMNQAVQYQFLAKDAPLVGLLLTKTIGNAEDYRIFASRNDALSGSPAVLTGPAIRLWMRQPRGATPDQPSDPIRQAILSFETIAGHRGIYFFLADDTTGTFPSTPSWELAGGELTNATFDLASANFPGVLLATLNGSYGDQYTFAAEKK
jgi:prepilin-type N-terminal cleavage/methylation domain-containing protein